MKKSLRILICAAFIALCAVSFAGAKTASSDAVSNVFFYAEDSAGKAALVTVMDLDELDINAHGQENGSSFMSLTIDRFPTVHYCEGIGYTLDELYQEAVNKAADEGIIQNVQELKFEGDNRIYLKSTDDKDYKENYDNYTYKELYGADRYYFPALYDAFMKYGKNYTKNEAVVNEIWESGIKMPAVVAVKSYGGRVTNLIEEGVFTSDVTGGELAGGLADRLDRLNVLRIIIPQTEDDMRNANSTTNNIRKWIYDMKLVTAGKSPIKSKGTVAAPSCRLELKGSTLTVTMSCATEGAVIYHSINGDRFTNTPQYKYTGPIVIENYSGDPVNIVMRAVKKGYDDKGAVSKVCSSKTAKAETLAVKSFKLTAPGGKKIKASWKKTSGASGYQIKTATDKNFTKNSKTYTVKSPVQTYTVKSLKAGKTYYGKIRTYKTIDGVKYYGSWSSVKKIKVKK